MSADLVFQDPGPKGRGPGGKADSPVARWLRELRQHPGQWAKYPELVHCNTRTDIAQGHRYGVTAGEFEATTRVTDPPHPKGKRTLFARYIGAES